MRKILIIQQKMIGDVLTSTFMCEVIKKKYPNIIIDYLINEHTYPVVKGNPYIDNIIMLTKEDEKSIFSLINFTKNNVKSNYDAIVDVYSKIESNIIALFTKSKIKVSYKKWYTSWIYNNSITTDSYHENGALNGRLCLLKPIFSEKFTITEPKIYLSEDELRSGKEFLRKSGIKEGENVFMIGVLGSGGAKTYPLNYIAKVIDCIAENSDAKFLFNYIPSQLEQAKKVYSLCSLATQQRILLEAYTKSLRDFLCVLKHCKALIGNEGGAVNMAKALKVPTFSIYSPQIKKEAWNTFSNSKNIGVHLKDYHPELFVEKPNYSKLYQCFIPNLFKEELVQFLKDINQSAS